MDELCLFIYEMYFPAFKIISEISNIWPSDFPQDEPFGMGWDEMGWTHTRTHTQTDSLSWTKGKSKKAEREA